MNQSHYRMLLDGCRHMSRLRSFPVVCRGPAPIQSTIHLQGTTLSVRALSKLPFRRMSLDEAPMVTV